MKKLICILIIIFPIFCIYSNNINNYDPEFIIKIENGKKSGQVWYDKYGLPHHTRAFTISKKENVYVCDPYNNRINMYDINLNFIKSIKNKDFASDGVAFADKIVVDDYEFLIIVDHIEGLYKYTIDGERLIKIPKNELSDSVLYSMHYYPFDNNIVFFNADKKLCLIDKDGNISNSKNSKANIIKFKESRNAVENKMYDYIKVNGLFYYNEKIFPKDFYDFNSLRTVAKQEIELLQQKKGVQTNKPSIDPDIFIEQLLVGYDNDNNIYWQGYWENYNTRAIAVFSKDLILLDLFTYKLDGKEDTYEAVAPNGDIYIMQPEPDGVYFYKITRQW